MDWTASLLILPFAGALAWFPLRASPRALKGIALLSAAPALIGLAMEIVRGPDPSTTITMLVVTLAAILALLGQQDNSRASMPLAITLLLLGLSLVGLAAGGPVTLWLLGTLMGVLLLLLSRQANREPGPLAWGAAVGLGIGLLSLAASTVATGGASALFRLVACAVLLPLFPFHTAFVGSLTSLPGALPAFLAVLLPALGWHGLQQSLAEVPAFVIDTLAPLALGGSLYVALRASVQLHLPRTLASIATVQIALVWWHAGVTGAAYPEAGWYLYIVLFASQGLLLAAHLVDARYGSMSLDRIRGLARPMPRFATLVGLLLMATIGLPVFGVFAGFLGMVATAPAARSVVVVLLIWLAVSLLMVSLLQRLLFREAPTDLIHRDLQPSEMAPLVLVVLLLTAAGFVPPDILRHDHQPATTVADRLEAGR